MSYPSPADHTIVALSAESHSAAQTGPDTSTATPQPPAAPPSRPPGHQPDPRTRPESQPAPPASLKALPPSERHPPPTASLECESPTPPAGHHDPAHQSQSHGQTCPAGAAPDQ